MPLSYKEGSAKAAKLSLIFRSTNKGKSIDGTAMSKSDVNTVSVSSDAVHTGSTLYVDDIELHY